jgi:hypothetical protein
MNSQILILIVVGVVVGYVFIAASKPLDLFSDQAVANFVAQQNALGL